MPTRSSNSCIYCCKWLGPQRGFWLQRANVWRKEASPQIVDVGTITPAQSRAGRLSPALCELALAVPYGGHTTVAGRLGPSAAVRHSIINCPLRTLVGLTVGETEGAPRRAEDKTPSALRWLVRPKCPKRLTPQASDYQHGYDWGLAPSTGPATAQGPVLCAMALRLLASATSAAPSECRS